VRVSSLSHQVRRRGVLPNLGVDADEVDLLVERFPDPIVTGVGDEVREAADVFVVPASADCPRSFAWRTSRRNPSGTEETAAPGDRRPHLCVRRAGDR
jgi:hypothetical protein